MEIYLTTFCNCTKLSFWSPDVFRSNQTLYHLDDCFQQTFLTIPLYLLMLCITFYYFGFYQNHLKTTINLCSGFVSSTRRILLILLTIINLAIFWTKSQDLLLVSSFAFALKISTILVTLVFNVQSETISNGFAIFKLSFGTIVILSMSECVTFYSCNLFDRITFGMIVTTSVLWFVHLIFLNLERKHHSLLVDLSEENTLANDERASFVSLIFFTWVTPLLVRGNKSRIDKVNDVFELPLSIQTQSFAQLVEDYLELLKIRKQSLARILLKQYGWAICLLGLLKLVADGMTFLSPIYLNKLLLYLDNSEDHSRTGFIFAFVLFASNFLNAMLMSIFNFKMSKMSLKIRTILMLTVYTKLFRVSSTILTHRFGCGQMLNLASTDVDRVVNFAPSLYQFISLPIQLVVTLYLLYREVGLVFLSGVIFILSLIPLNKYICTKIGQLSQKMMLAKDARIKLMSEIVKGVRTIKMHHWERSFIARILAIRAREMKYLKARKYLDALCVYFWATTPVIISSLVFGCFVLFEGSDSLTSSKVFTSLALLSMLIMPLNALPWVLNGLIEALVSLRRLESFFFLDEIDFHKDYSLSSAHQDKQVLRIENGQFTYDGDRETSLFTLSIDDFTLPPKSFIGVVGRVGSGKSSFLKCMINEMNKQNGTIHAPPQLLKNGLGYVPQSPWILNTTIRENILFGKEFEPQFYWRVVESCALTKDLQLLANGDQTIVGDHGALLSGGQKSRIALARAVYQDFEVYLIDEPFSSVDIYVAQEIYSKLFVAFLGARKTIVLVTNHLDYLCDCDSIVYLENGNITRMPASDLAIKELSAKGFISTEEDKKMQDADNDVAMLEDKIEERKHGIVAVNIYVSYFQAIGCILSVAIIVSICLMQLSKCFSDFWLSIWVSNKSPSSTSLYLYTFIAIGVVNSFITLVRAFTFAYGGIRAAVNVHNLLLSSVLLTSLQFFESTPFGVIINRFSSDVFNVDDALPFTLNIFLAQLSGLIASLIVSTYGLPWIGFIIVPLLFPYYLVQKYFREVSRELKRLSAVSLSPIYSLLDDTIQGLVVIRAYADERRFKCNFNAKVNDYNRIQYAVAAVQQWLNVRLQFMGVAVTSGVAFLSVYLHYYRVGEVKSSFVGLSLVYSLSLTSLLNGAVQAFAQTELDIISVERIRHLLSMICERFDSLEQSSEESVPKQIDFSWPKHGVVCFENVSMRYQPDANLALDDVSFETVPGEHIAIVGRTGSGKSSIFQVLFRLAQIEAGLVSIDGVHISTLSIQALRSNIFIIPQDAFLFSATIRDNLDPLGRYRDDEIWTALYSCSINMLVDSLGGLDVCLQESGKDLSLGQRHLFCLARAVLNRKHVVCIDELSANIDLETETIFKELLETVFQTSTILYITHRLESIPYFDRVLVMDSGRVVKLCSATDYLSSL